MRTIKALDTATRRAYYWAVLESEEDRDALRDYTANLGSIQNPYDHPLNRLIRRATPSASATVLRGDDGIYGYLDPSMGEDDPRPGDTFVDADGVEWVAQHDDPAYAEMSPVCWDEFLDNENKE